MADVYTSLMQSAVFKRAALLEAWRLRHAEHYPGPQFQTDFGDATISTARCSCGAAFTITIVISLVTDSIGEE